jgi:hypothetical protein
VEAAKTASIISSQKGSVNLHAINTSPQRVATVLDFLSQLKSPCKCRDLDSFLPKFARTRKLADETHVNQQDRRSRDEIQSAKTCLTDGGLQAQCCIFATANHSSETDKQCDLPLRFGAINGVPVRGSAMTME